MDDRHLTLIQCNVNEAELDLRLIIGRESHLDQSHAATVFVNCGCVCQCIHMIHTRLQAKCDYVIRRTHHLLTSDCELNLFKL